MKRLSSGLLLLAVTAAVVVERTGGPPGLLPAPEASVGGVSFLCAALGILTGASILHGNYIGAAGFALWGLESGCI